MTETKLASMIADGYGRGRGEGFMPWIRIRRKLSSPVSNLQSMANPMYGRALQLLSGLESDAANVALWLGASEIREQHPAWPSSHMHPAAGIHPEFDRKLGMVPGLLEIAKSAGIDHGVYPGTKIPFVATLDFTLGIGSWNDNQLVQWSCKPRSLLESAPNRARMHERIEMERHYSRVVNAKHVVIDGTEFSRQLTENLDWMRPLRSEMKRMKGSQRLSDYGCYFMLVAASCPITAAKRYAARKTGLERKEMEDHFRAAAWLGAINIDMTQSVVMSRPLAQDSKGFKESLRRRLFGAEDDNP